MSGYNLPPGVSLGDPHISGYDDDDDDDSDIHWCANCDREADTECDACNGCEWCCECHDGEA